MYHKAYGIIETLAPLHVGASAGEETGNLNLIFRDQFTQTGIIPGSSIRGRFRADMRQQEEDFERWYGAEAKTGEPNSTTEGIIKFEYASILWMPVYCPNQPVVRVSCPALLKRYHKLATGKLETPTFKPYSYYGKKSGEKLFFNLGFLQLGDKDENLKHYIPNFVSDHDTYLLLVVDDTDMSMIHDMALYRQSRVSLETKQKRAKKGAFFDVEALPEGTIMTFPLASRKTFQRESVQLQTFFRVAGFDKGRELYFGGLESVGFGRAQVTLQESNSKLT
ncbi:RAMP superfamily CRISPR-associated protein [Sphaerothrix gracilis]|uniref:RAMP superfamily CRISPR-associated protein n=1 Tax=Sphaerothrix gracilis TaxID=3151835 RepID=UPI0031FD51CE